MNERAIEDRFEGPWLCDWKGKNVCVRVAEQRTLGHVREGRGGGHNQL